MSIYCAVGGVDCELDAAALQGHFTHALDQLGKRQRVLALPPDQSRIHSRAGVLTTMAWRYYGSHLQAVMPAIGTHRPMTPQQIAQMFPGMPLALFHEHNWRHNVVCMGEVPADFIHEQSEGKLDFTWPAEVNRMLPDGGFDLILSIGQVVPHEVIGMANYTKNVLVGTGGARGIHRSHYLGAIYGIERIMGQTDTPVRRVLNYAASHFLGHLPIVYALTVVGQKADGSDVVRGLFIGDDDACYQHAAALSRAVNIEHLECPIHKAVVSLDASEYHSTWIGNKAIYRTRMALADDAELIILAPGVCCFGEDPTIDRLIRRHGYKGTSNTLAAVESDAELSINLSAAAHLIHGSSEGRFRITWAPGALSKSEVEAAGFNHGDLQKLTAHYHPATLHHGWNSVGGKEIFYIANPGLGLWSARNKEQH